MIGGRTGRMIGLLCLAGACTAFQAASAAAPQPCTLHHRHHHRGPAMTAGDPGLRSASALVMDQSDSAVWYARRADVAAPIASITKLMTALVVADAHQPMDEVLQVTAADRAIGRGAASRLAIGTRLTRGELLHLALMSSENRAAHALGRNYPGGVPAFVQAMNAKAAALGMSTAHFVEPTGLSSDNVASPDDLSKLVMAAAQDPIIRDYSTDTEHSVRIGRRMVEFRNTDALVRKRDWNIVVQKTGFINEAGRCLVMQAVIDGRDIVIVLLDSFGKYTRVADAIRVRKWIEARLSEHAGHGVTASGA
ncbi:MAG TPA: D-alanyl-D-alanine endopeptidase [Steroidobacteraceae bacterium]|nr:D-alanyl-D-alanine endopeptidase [Steroidobacteraceae bacterium]